MAIKFKELKKYISRVVRLSICFENGFYDNYLMISDIPEGKYDDMYVYGIGMVDVEFPMDVYASPKSDVGQQKVYLGHALEIVLRDEDRGLERQADNFLLFGDLRGYLQLGRFFSIMMKDEWKSDCYEWKREIPDKYNNMVVYGIGIEDSPEAYRIVKPTDFFDTCLVKRMCIVLEKKN